jgi:(1->4)-alpha-D-glucan 1-alpha-D-glucosylmutase
LKENSLESVANVADFLRRISAQQRIPSATYRLQFNRDFTFRDARALVPYLHDLGISDYYASPIFRPRSGSSHGYDICDHSQFNPAVGNEDDFAHLASTLQSHGMGLILDVVPNHMGIGHADNIWWLNVLENGPSSSYASYFDIDWHPVKVDLENKVLLPLLEDQYGTVLESSKFRLALEEGAFVLYYYETKLPVAPRAYSIILSYPVDELVQQMGKRNEHLQEYQSILTALNYLPSRTESTPEKLIERFREKEVIKRRIANLYNTCAARCRRDSASLQRHSRPAP